MQKKTIRLYNTLSRTVEEVFPQDGSTFRMYTCGPTIYDVAHIGNFRTFLFEDLLRRTLQLFGYNVFQVMNLTDVDDKTIKGAVSLNLPLKQYTDQYKKAFFEDLDSLKIQHAERYPEATAYIPKMIDMITTLLQKKAAYIHSDNSVYFSIRAAKEYGKLSHLNLEELSLGASKQNSVDEYSKESPTDFVLWKAFDEKRDGSIYWDSPWGKGRPGWHIECSVMAKDLLGSTIDIHAGGVDLIFPHHENEIAQSETCNDAPFARYWIHAEHLLVDHKKMSKSLGNFYTLRDLLKLGYDPVAIRFFLLSNHYRTQLNFTLPSLDSAASSIKRIRDFAHRLSSENTPVPTSDFLRKLADDTADRFQAALANDLNTSEALASLFDLIRSVNHHIDSFSINKLDADRLHDLLLQFDSIFAFLLPTPEALPEKVQALIEQRKKARHEKQWALSDALRKELSTLGYKVEDLSDGQRVSKETECQPKN